MRRLLPTPATDVAPAEEYAVPDRPWLRVNMVASIDGAATDGEGLSGGVSGEPDRALFRVLRSLCDAVVVGARTAAAEGYRPAAVPVVLLTRSLDLDAGMPLLAGAGRVLVAAPAVAVEARPEVVRLLADRSGAELITAGHDSLDLAVATTALRARGLRHLLAEGGPTVLAALLAAGLVDELCVTTSPRVLGGGAGRIVTGSTLADSGPWSLAGLYEDRDYLFARWRTVAAEG